MASLGEAVIEIGADTAGFERDVKGSVDKATSSASKSMKNLGGKMTGVGKKMTLGVTTPLVGIGVAAVKTAGDFEQSMNVLQAATGMGSSEMKKLQKQAIQLGADTVFSANESAEAMVELGKAGMDAGEIMAATPEVLSLAATEGLGLAQAAGIVTSSMAPFQLKADEVGQAVNALAGASNASKASVATLSDALKLVGGAAAGTGLSVQETTGALAALAQNGLEGGIAGTSLAGVLRRLQPTTKAASTAMEELGLSFVDSKGNFDSIDTIAGKLQKTFKGMAPAARQAALSKIFGNDASTMQAVNALINTGAKGMREYTKASSDQNAASDLAEAKMKGIKGAMEQMSGAIETASLAIGQALIPVVTTVANVIGDLAGKFTTLSPTAQRIVVAFAAVAAAAGPLLIIVGTLISSIGTIAGVFAGLTVAVAAPIVAIAALAAGIAFLLYKSEDARATVVSAFEQIKAAVMPAISEIGGVIQGTLLPAFSAIWPVIQKVGEVLLKVFAGAVVGAVKGLVNVVVGAFKVIGGVVDVVAGLLTGDWSRLWGGLKDILGGLLQAILGVIQLWWNVSILGFFKRGFAFLTKGLWVKMWAGLKAGATKGFAAIGNAIRAGAKAAVNIFRNGIRLYITIWRNIFSTAFKVVRGGWNNIRGMFSGALGKIKGVVTKGFNAVKNSISSAFNSMRSAASKGVSNILSAVMSLPGKIRGLGSKFKGAGKAVIDAFIGGLSRAGSIATDFAQNIWNAVRSAINSGIDKLNSLLEFDFKVKGVGFTVNAPDIGHVATGTQNYPGGISMVGEHGPELVQLPSRSRVYPSGVTQNMLNEAMGQGGNFPSKVILRVGARDFVAYVESIADDRIDAADSLAWQGA